MLVEENWFNAFTFVAIWLYMVHNWLYVDKYGAQSVLYVSFIHACRRRTFILKNGDKAVVVSPFFSLNDSGVCIPDEKSFMRRICKPSF